MSKKNHQRPERPLNELFGELLQEIQAVDPQDEETEERFFGFQIMPNIQTKIRKAIELFEDGERDGEAREVISEVLNHLRVVQIFFFRGSLGKFFEPRLQDLIDGGLDEDLQSRVQKALDPIRLQGTRQAGIRLEMVGELYNAACEALDEAKDEQESRERNRAQRAREAREIEEAQLLEAQREESQQQQREADERRLKVTREERTSLVDEMQRQMGIA